MIETEVKKLIKAIDSNNTLLARLCDALESTGTLEVTPDVGNTIPNDPPRNDILDSPAVVSPASDPVPTSVPTDPAPASPSGPMMTAQAAPTQTAPVPSDPGEPTGELNPNIMTRLAKCSQVLNDPFLVNKLCKQVGVANVGMAATTEQQQWMVQAAEDSVQAAGRML